MDEINTEYSYSRTIRIYNYNIGLEIGAENE